MAGAAPPLSEGVSPIKSLNQCCPELDVNLSNSGPSTFSSDGVQTQLIAYSSQIKFRISSD